MKLFMRILLLLIVLSFGFAGAGTRPAQARSGITLKPGEYYGDFNLLGQSTVDTPLTAFKVTKIDKLHFEVYMKGKITIKATSATKAKAFIDVTQIVIQERDSFGIHGVGPLKTRIDCDRQGTLFEDAEPVFLATLLENFDPATSNFLLPGTIADFKNPTYSKSGKGVSEWEQCNAGIAQDTLTTLLKGNVKHFEDLNFHVRSASGNLLSGDMRVDNWETAGPLKRSFKGSWLVNRVPDNPAGLERKGKKK
jgi:hypothetical protein